jgi:DNA-binding winged helix-turn-helix (wHTH) protein/tetratricopeptide (TPR) repeat protein
MMLSDLAVTGDDHKSYQFGSLLLDGGQAALFHSGEIVSLPPKAFEILVLLLEQRGRIVSKKDLLDRIWPDTFVEEGNLAKNISGLRRVLALYASDCHIENVPKRGYRFVGVVQTVADGTANLTVESNAGASGSKAAEHLVGLQIPSASVLDPADGLGLAAPEPHATQSWVRRLTYPLNRWSRATTAMILIAAASIAYIWRLQRSTSEIDASAGPRPSPAAPRPKGTNSAEAYRFYLEGQQALREKSHNGLFKGIAAFQRAIERDPNFAQAYVGLAEGYAGDLLSLKKVDAVASKALSLDPSLAGPHSTLGFIRMFRDHNWSEAERELKIAAALSPNDPKVWQYYAQYFAIQGDLKKCEQELRLARDLDPSSLSIRADLARTAYFKRDYERCIQDCRSILVQDPNFFDAHMLLYLAYVVSGRYDEAFDEYVALIELWRYYPTADISRLRAAYYTSKPSALWREQIKLVRFWNFREEEKAYELAESHTLLGETDAAFRWLNTACDKPINYWLLYLKVNPLFDSLHSDARFASILARLGLPQ